MEALVSKLCIRFRVSVTSRQWCDLAFCLSIINYNDKALKHLIDNIPHLVEKLHNSQVYAYFKHIGTAMGKSTKPDIKVSSKLTNRDFLHRCYTLNFFLQALAGQLIEKIDQTLKSAKDGDGDQAKEDERPNTSIRPSQKTMMDYITKKPVEKKKKLTVQSKGKSSGKTVRPVIFSSDDSSGKYLDARSSPWFGIRTVSKFAVYKLLRKSN